MEMFSRVTATINCQALRHNLNLIKRLCPEQKILAMIKANAYGHGAIEVAQALSAADGFGVACIAEALTLRAAGITKPIVVMMGFTSETELKLFAEQQLSPVIHHAEQINILEKTAINNLSALWFKIDTGMHRLGFMRNEAENHYQRLKQLGHLRASSLTIMTHLADADDLTSPHNQQQLNAFTEATANWPHEKSVFNSAGILSGPQACRYDWIRPGIMLYGISPFAEQTGPDLGLQPVMTLSTKILELKALNPGECVGYGSTWRAERPSQIALVSCGYGDGYPRNLNLNAPTLINGQICPIVGRVSMDQIAIDVTDVSSISLADEVILWGPGLALEKVAAHSDLFTYELVTQLGQRVHYRYVNG